jgi:hypothetical protein
MLSNALELSGWAQGTSLVSLVLALSVLRDVRMSVDYQLGARSSRDHNDPPSWYREHSDRFGAYLLAGQGDHAHELVTAE